MSLAILAIQVQPKLKGERKKSWVCSVTSYGVPTASDWAICFVGYHPELKEKILAEFDAWANFGSLEQEEIAHQKYRRSYPTTVDPDGETDASCPAYEEL